MRRLSRRHFLQGLTAVGAAAAGLPGCAPKSRLIEAPTTRPGKPILVIIDLDGGNDWLNMLAPTGGPNRAAYEARRPTLGIKASQLVDLGGGLGLNLDFTGMSLLADRGRVAWIPGIGMDNPNLSHFVSIDLWGQGAASPNGTGWLGRYADAAFSASDVLKGVTVTGDLPVMLRGATRSFVSITGSRGFVFPSSLAGGKLGTPWDPALLQAGFDTAVSNPTPGGPPGETAAAVVGKAFLTATQSFGNGGTLPPRTPSVAYPGDSGYPVRRVDGSALSGGLAYQLKLMAQMIANGIDAQVFFARLGGWDTHANQAIDHANLMRTLGGSISAFYQDLASISTADGSAQDRTMILVWSEFGRRVPQNNNGTDHGTAGLAFCVGRGVKGGVYGASPDLATLDNGNMISTVDFRQLYATVLEGWLGQSAAATDGILGRAYPRLGFL
jgi:uncharacterized protein (DUF1501 family)